MVKHGPGSAVTDFNSREENRVEVNVVFAHELVKTNILGVEPPLLPLWCIASSYTRVSNGSVKLLMFT